MLFLDFFSVCLVANLLVTLRWVQFLYDYKVKIYWVLKCRWDMNYE